MKKGIIIFVILLVITVSVAALQKGEGIVGSGQPIDPYHVQDGVIGVVEDCSLRVFDGSSWATPASFTPLQVLGDGSRDNPFRVNGQDYGLTCLPGFSVEKVYVSALVQPGSRAAAIGSSEQAPSPVVETCNTPRCIEIDEVWQKIQGLLQTAKPEAKLGFWDPIIRQWKTFLELHPGKKTIPSSTTSSTSTIPANARENAGVQKDLAAGLYTEEFLSKVEIISKDLNINPIHLLAVMYFESGRKFDPAIRNPNGGATGLIQFIPSTAADLGTTTAALAAMTQVEQLDYVKKYFEKNGKGIRPNNLGDVAMAVFYPKGGIGKENDAILFSTGSLAYTRNQSLDKNNDGHITRGEYLAVAADAYSRYGLTVE